MSDAVAIALIQSVGIFAGIVWSNRKTASKLDDMHKQYNSRFDEQLAMQKKIGVQQGKDEQKTINGTT